MHPKGYQNEWVSKWQASFLSLENLRHCGTRLFWYQFVGEVAQKIPGKSCQILAKVRKAPDTFNFFETRYESNLFCPTKVLS